MPDTKKWKSKLLSSSIPLEYEVAKILVDCDFAVDADYSYFREDAGVLKDFSVDILATAYPPFSKSEVLAEIFLLIECKYRHSNNKWFFFPDPNVDGFATFMPGCTLRAIDAFSYDFFRSRCTDAFEKDDGTVCLKGVEIDLSTGSVHDAEIKHGLAQLQYALPRLLTESILFNVLVNHPEDNFPFFFCPILLTSSQILVAKANVTIEQVKQAEALEDISAPEPYVFVHLDSTPDFNLHRQHACSPLTKLLDDPRFQKIDAARKKARVPPPERPAELCSRLADVNGGKFMEYFSQAVVCTTEHLPILVKRLKLLANDAARRKRKKHIAMRSTRVSQKTPSK